MILGIDSLSRVAVRTTLMLMSYWREDTEAKWPHPLDIRQEKLELSELFKLIQSDGVLKLSVAGGVSGFTVIDGKDGIKPVALETSVLAMMREMRCRLSA